MRSDSRTIRFLLPCVLAFVSQPNLARSQDSAPPTWSPKAAANYLDERAEWWLGWPSAGRGQGTACVSCHTTMPFALARPALGARLGETNASALETKLVENVKKRVANWDKIVVEAPGGKDPFTPFYQGKRRLDSLGTEAVLNALLLVNNDAIRAKGVLSEPTRKSLDHLWGQQRDTGAWRWLDFGLRPWETDGDYLGASLAAIAVGTAGADYYDRSDIKPKAAALRAYLRTQFANQSLHNRAMGLWASSKLPDVLSDGDKKRLIEELAGIQEADGGWRLASLGKSGGDWKSHGLYPEAAISDGYATGLVVLALRRGGVPNDDAKLKKAIAWLSTRQIDGTWPTAYINRARNPRDDIGKFMRDAATAFAVLALSETE